MLKRLFTDHPATVDETYGQHFSVAGWYGMRMLGGGLACLVHAVFPFVFLRTGSATIKHLHQHMTSRMGSPNAAASPAPAPTKPQSAAPPIADGRASQG
ncbi:MAG: DUF6356 family protein [Alphaproteobacteria bacterium]